MMEDKDNLIKSTFIGDRPFKVILPRFKEVFFSVEALISSLLVIFPLIFMYIIAKDDFETYINLINNLIIALITGLIAMIAFSLSALALILTSFRIEDVRGLITESPKGIFNKEKLHGFRLIIYRFFMSSILNLSSIILLVIGYFILNLPVLFPNCVTYLYTFIVSYLTVFSLIFSTLLIPTCIKMKFFPII